MIIIIINYYIINIITLFHNFNDFLIVTVTIVFLIVTVTIVIVIVNIIVDI